MKLSSQELILIRDKKRMKSVVQVAQETGINRWTLSNLISGKQETVKQSTYRKLIKWINYNPGKEVK